MSHLRGLKVTKNPVCPFIVYALLLSHPVLAQEAIRIEIDSAPVEVEIDKPAEPAPAAEPAEPAPPEPVQAQTGEPEEPEKDGPNYTMAIGIGALVAGLLAALAGGGGGSGGGSSTPQHP